MDFQTKKQNASTSRVVALVTILVVVAIVAVASGYDKRPANAKVLVMKGNDGLRMYQDEARVTPQGIAPMLNYVPREMELRVKPDFPPGYIHVMNCGHDQAGKLFWNELNGGLAGVQNVAKTKAVAIRFYDAITGRWVESTVILGGTVKSVADNLKANTVLNGHVPGSYRGTAWRDFNFHGSDGAAMSILGFSCDPYTYAKGTFAAGSVYFACGHGGGLHINKVGPTAPWNGVCTFNTPNVRKNTHVLLYYKTLAC